MDHPLLLDANSSLRKRVIQFFQTAFSVRRNSNIIFVCGGLEDHQMRLRFKTYCESEFSDYVIFFPEHAMDSYFADVIDEPFDIADFEELIAHLSHAVVVFPEAPGSYAETGYFSAISELAEKTILALDVQYQTDDSFISMGPAKKIGAASLYQPILQIDYENPNFETITERIQRHGKKRYKTHLTLQPFSEVSTYQLFCLIHTIVDVVTVATFADIVYLLRGLSKATVSVSQTRKLISILVGAQHLIPIGEFGHVTVNKSKGRLLELREGHHADNTEIRLALAETFESYEEDFLALIEQAADAN